MNEQIIYRSIAIPLDGFEHLHAPHGSSENLDYLFVGRKDIIDKLVDLLASKTRRGSYLITGYRGAGKTSVINKAIDKYRKGEKGKKRDALVIRINLGDNSELTPLNIYYSISTILRDQLVQEGLISRLRVLPALKRIDELIERMSFEISSARNSRLEHSFRRFRFSFWESRNKTRLPINAREAEEALSTILQQLQGLNVKNRGTNRKIVFVLDEIDKLSDSEELSEIQYRRRTDVQELSKTARINTLLGSLKNFVTTADATFFFISGRETLDRYYSEKGSSNSLYESLFDCVFEVPSFLTDKGERRRGTRLSALMEEYVCRRLRPKRDDLAYVENDEDNRFLDYYTLKDYHKSLTVRLPGNQRIFRGVNTLRSFIHYLTFHSWGNPKRLSSIFESFVVPRHQVMRNLEKPNSILYLSEDENNARHWLFFTANHQRSFSLASEITTLFQHQLSREVSKISDKLTVSTLSSLHFILKLHSYGFTRESLHRMSEAINVHRSPELNTIVDELLTHVFKSYIRRVRNGIFRYRFNSGFEQELRYISHVSELESATYNFSLDSMKHVKKFFEDVVANSGTDDTGVISRSHITLGDMCAIEQSYTAASVHYSSASRILDSLLSKGGIPANEETLMQYIEAMIKHGDLEERRQNYNHAAAIYFEASRMVEDHSKKDENLQRHLHEGDSKWDLLKQPFWASRFLSLKRSPSTKVIERPKYLYALNDPRFSYRAANLYFFDGQFNLAINAYSSVMTGPYDATHPSSLRSKLKIFLKSLSSPDERDAYLKGKAVVGIAETMLVQKSDELFRVYPEKNYPPAEREQNEREQYFADLLEKHLSSENSSASRVGTGAVKYLDVIFDKAANAFEQNQLYISAAITHIEAISYYTAILDVFDNSTFKDEKKKNHLLYRNWETQKLILEKGRKAIRCIDKARQLETSQSIKTTQLYDVELGGTVESQKDITRLFDMLLERPEKESFPVSEPVFWQNSLWAHKLAAALCWARYVKRKIEQDPDEYSPDENVPGSLPSILAVTGFSVRPGILFCWICARDWNRQYIEKKLTTIEGKGCGVNAVLNNILEPKSESALTNAAETILEYVALPAEKRTQLGRSAIPATLEKAYMIARYLYFAHEFSRKISRKNLDLIFPRLPQLYFAQWKLLLNLISPMLLKNREITKNTGESLASVRDFSFMLQRVFISLDQELVPEETVAPSHFDYEFIYLRLCESLESSISLVDRTSRAHKNIFQHKYFCHDDHSDPDFRMDYTLAYMFTPRARYLKREIEETHSLLIKCAAPLGGIQTG